MAAIIRIEIQSSGGVDAVKKDVAGLGDAAEGAGKKFSALGEIGIGALRALGTMGVDLAVKGLQAIGSAISDGIEDAKQNAQIQAQTAAVIKSTGEAAGVSAQHVADYASSLSDAAGKSLFGDDQIQQSTNLLLTFTNIKGASLDAATAISVDMAQALGGAPKDAAIQLGKALNDPIKGITALTRVGVTFSDEQKAQIQAMQEAGDMAGAQAVILAELNKEFGGSAQAAADATGGWSEFNGRMGEAKETLGAAVLPLLNMLAGVLNDTVLPIVESAAATFGDLVTAFQTGAEGGDFLGGIINALYSLENLSPVFGMLGDLILTLADAGPLSSEFAEVLGSIGEQIGPIFDSLVESASNWIANAIPPFLAKAAEFFGTLIGWVNASLPGWIEELGKLAAAAVEWVVAALPGLATRLSELGTSIINWVVNSLPGWIAEFQKIETAIIQWVTDAMPGLGTNLGLFAGKLLGWIVQTAIDVVPKLADLAFKFLSWVATDVIPKLPGVLLAIATGIYNFISEVVKEVGPKLVTLAEKFLNWVATDVIPKLPGVMDTIKTSIGDWVGTAVTWAGTKLAEIGTAVVDGIKSGVSSAWGSFTSWLMDRLEGLKDDVLAYFGIASPSKVFADEVGAPIVQGLIVGIQGMIPGLTDVLEGVAVAIIAKAKKVTEKVVDDANAMQDALIDQAQGIADKLSGVMADALLGTASLDRAKAKAIGALKDISAAQQEEVQKQLTAAAQVAGGFGDPKQAAAFFKQRSDQIFELAKLRDQIEKTTDEAAKARLIEQYNLIGKAQQTELQALAAKGNTSPLQAITEKLQALLANTNLPGALDPGGGVLGQLFAALPQLVAMSQSPVPAGVTQTSSSQFTYAPTVTTTAPVVSPIDYATARALAGQGI